MDVLSVICVCKTAMESGSKLLSLQYKEIIQTSMHAEALFLTKNISGNKADILFYPNTSAKARRKKKLDDKIH